MSKLPKAGGNLHDHPASAAPIDERSFGGAPSVGQSKAYVSGSNAHGVHQPKTKDGGGAESKQGGHFYAKPAMGKASR